MFQLDRNAKGEVWRIKMTAYIRLDEAQVHYQTEQMEPLWQSMAALMERFEPTGPCNTRGEFEILIIHKDHKPRLNLPEEKPDVQTYVVRRGFGVDFEKRQGSPWWKRWLGL